MNALRKPRPPEPNRKPQRPTRAPRVAAADRTRAAQRALALEVGAKLAVNSLLAVAGLVSLVRLIPYMDARTVELQQLETEVARLEGRVHQLKAEWVRQFDPNQAIGTMQEETRRIRPGDRYAIWPTPRDQMNEPANNQPSDPGGDRGRVQAAGEPAIAPSPGSAIEDQPDRPGAASRRSAPIPEPAASPFSATEDPGDP